MKRMEFGGNVRNVFLSEKYFYNFENSCGKYNKKLSLG